MIFDIKKIKIFTNGDLPKEFQEYPQTVWDNLDLCGSLYFHTGQGYLKLQSRNFKFFIYICVIAMRDIEIYRVIRLYL